MVLAALRLRLARSHARRTTHAHTPSPTSARSAHRSANRRAEPDGQLPPAVGHSNIALPLRELRAFDEDFIHDMVMLKLDLVDIERRHAWKMPSDLSGGMVKRIALARALALEPELLFLDEPTAGLDPDRSESFVKLIQSLQRSLNFTVVMVTHDLDTLVSLSSRIAVLAEKHVLAVGPACDVLRVQHPFIKHFFLGPRGQRALEVLEERHAQNDSED